MPAQYSRASINHHDPTNRKIPVNMTSSTRGATSRLKTKSIAKTLPRGSFTFDRNVEV